VRSKGTPFSSLKENSSIMNIPSVTKDFWPWPIDSSLLCRRYRRSNDQRSISSPSDPRRIQHVTQQNPFSPQPRKMHVRAVIYHPSEFSDQVLSIPFLVNFTYSQLNYAVHLFLKKSCTMTPCRAWISKPKRGSKNSTTAKMPVVSYLIIYLTFMLKKAATINF